MQCKWHKCSNQSRTRSEFCSDTCSKRYRRKTENPSNCQQIRAETIPGFVYIIQSGDSDYYKIGCTARRPIARVRDLQTGSPVELRLYEVFYSYDMGQLEKDGQAFFRGKHVRGEWYELTQWELDRLAAYLAKDELYIYYTEHDQLNAQQAGQRVASVLADYEYNDILPDEVKEEVLV